MPVKTGNERARAAHGDCYSLPEWDCNAFPPHTPTPCPPLPVPKSSSPSVACIPGCLNTDLLYHHREIRWEQGSISYSLLWLPPHPAVWCIMPCTQSAQNKFWLHWIRRKETWNPVPGHFTLQWTFALTLINDLVRGSPDHKEAMAGNWLYLLSIPSFLYPGMTAQNLGDFWKMLRSHLRIGDIIISRNTAVNPE